MKTLATALFAVSILATPMAYADESSHNHNHSDASATAGVNEMSNGEIKKVDKEAAKLTIKHGPLKNVGMSAMTMAFRVKDPAMLNQVKEGDKVNFIVEKVNGNLTVTKIEAAK